LSSGPAAFPAAPRRGWSFPRSGPCVTLWTFPRGAALSTYSFHPHGGPTLGGKFNAAFREMSP